MKEKKSLLIGIRKKTGNIAIVLLVNLLEFMTFGEFNYNFTSCLNKNLEINIQDI
jgi:hypothetical protein